MNNNLWNDWEDDFIITYDGDYISPSEIIRINEYDLFNTNEDDIF